MLGSPSLAVAIVIEGHADAEQASSAIFGKSTRPDSAGLDAAGYRAGLPETQARRPHPPDPPSSCSLLAIPRPTKVHRLDVRADDYVTKPFSTEVYWQNPGCYAARQRKPAEAAVIEVRGAESRQPHHRVTIAGDTVDTSPTEFRLLHFFVTQSERVHSRSQLLDQV
ncbi:MAG: hypothetical protein H6978_09445 [Gammaproteobacteria bacterium]|nr:hypothetical protein [Gammaproteobacteria bacterium]